VAKPAQTSHRSVCCASAVSRSVENLIADQSVRRLNATPEPRSPSVVWARQNCIHEISKLRHAGGRRNSRRTFNRHWADFGRICSRFEVLRRHETHIGTNEDFEESLILPGFSWWTHKGSNLGPLPCEGTSSLLNSLMFSSFVGRLHGFSTVLRVRGADANQRNRQQHAEATAPM
jgi:hypothetical protein